MIDQDRFDAWNIAYHFALTINNLTKEMPESNLLLSALGETALDIPITMAGCMFVAIGVDNCLEPAIALDLAGKAERLLSYAAGDGSIKSHVAADLFEQLAIIKQRLTEIVKFGRGFKESNSSCLTSFSK